MDVKGADRYAKKYALELGLQYQEFPHFTRLGTSIVPKDKRDYGKPYNVKNFFARNKIIAAYILIMLWHLFQEELIQRFYVNHKLC